jgi:hypothetical protein
VKLARIVTAILSAGACTGQGLVPRAYVITPTGANAIIVNYNYSTGDILFDPSIPITNSSAQISFPVLSYYYGFGLFGRSTNFTASLPYGVGNFSDDVAGNAASVYRSGLLDGTLRFSINLKGGPAMPLREFLAWRQKLLIGASLLVVVPTGQYDPARLINNGSNRWAFRPEAGLSRRWGPWLLDAYLGVWLYTANSQFYPGSAVKSQSPIGSTELHLSYDVKPRFWISADANFWYGGEGTINGVKNPFTRQQNSRAGFTASIPITTHQSLKFSYSVGAYIRFGGDYKTASVAWQYGWITGGR